MIKIRLSRGGRIHKPIYTIVAADARSPRDGRFLEKLGQYNPSAKDDDKVLVDVKVDAMKAWLDKGAVLTDSVRTLLKRQKISL
jgi:small subunit ribosomal protein S16